MLVILLLVLVPVIAGVTVWAAGDRRPRFRAVVALGSGAVTLATAITAALDPPSQTWRWGDGLDLDLTVVEVARAPVVLVAFVAAAVTAYALGYGEERGRSRMVGLLLVFAGAMELLLVAGDFLTLVIAWELVGVVSWGLIAHHWRRDGPPNAAHAFLATRAGDLGLFAAAGGAFAAGDTLAFDALPLEGTASAHLIAGGVVLAAVAKSAQLPFSPWLFSAMAGPTPASALLHAATMVAAGAYLVARLQPFLDTVGWFAPVAIGVGLATALAGGVVAFLAPRAKELLAASTSAQYGLMFVAVGAGYPSVATAHLVAHGLFKALLFVSAGVAIDDSGTEQLVGMRLSSRLRVVAGLTALGSLSLAAVPPLGAAWTKEQVVAASAHAIPWIGALVVAAGGLSALYAARFQLVAYGRPPEFDDGPAAVQPLAPSMPLRRHPWAVLALGLLAIGGLALAPLWTSWGEERLLDVTGGVLPTGTTWELVASLVAVGVAVYAAVVADRRGLLAAPATTETLHRIADWFSIGRVSRRAIVDPILRLAAMASRFDDVVLDAVPRAVGRTGSRLAPVLASGDDRVVDAGVRGAARFGAWAASVLDRLGEWSFDGAAEGLARLTGAAGRDGLRLQTGMTHHYYAGIATVLAVLVVASIVWS